jgi:hypothetical protein
MYPLLLGRLGLPKLTPGAVAHIKYPIVISDQSFRSATGFRPEHAEYETLAAFRGAAPPRGEAPASKAPANAGAPAQASTGADAGAAAPRGGVDEPAGNAALQNASPAGEAPASKAGPPEALSIAAPKPHE